MKKKKYGTKKNEKRKTSIFEIIVAVVVVIVLFLMRTQSYGAERLTNWDILQRDPKYIAGTVLAFFFILICALVIKNIKLR